MEPSGNWDFDIGIMDVQMSEMDGCQATKPIDRRKLLSQISTVTKQSVSAAEVR